MVQTSPFCGKPNEDTNAHLQNFLELCKKVKQWFYQNKKAVSTWDKCSVAFLAKFFPLGKTNTL